MFPATVSAAEFEPVIAPSATRRSRAKRHWKSLVWKSGPSTVQKRQLKSWCLFQKGAGDYLTLFADWGDRSIFNVFFQKPVDF